MNTTRDGNFSMGNTVFYLEIDSEYVSAVTPYGHEAKF